MRLGEPITPQHVVDALGWGADLAALHRLESSAKTYASTWSGTAASTPAQHGGDASPDERWPQMGA
jgi:hypothetical protein